MWKLYKTADGRLDRCSFLINETRVIIIQPKEKQGKFAGSYRVINYKKKWQLGVSKASYFYEEDFELAKLMGLVKAKELGWNIISVC